MYAIKDLFGTQVTANVNVINHVILVSIYIIKIVSVEKKLVDKLVEECTETNNEVKLARITLAENENKHKRSSYTLYIVLFSIVSTINVGIGTYFVYYKYTNRNKETEKILKILFFRQQLLDAIY